MNRQLEADKLALMEELEGQRHICDEVNKKVKENKDLSLRMEQMQKEKDELSLQLDSAQKTIQSLSLQVSTILCLLYFIYWYLQLTELSQTDSIQRLRLSYEAAFEEMKKQHEIELSNLVPQNTGGTSSSPVPQVHILYMCMLNHVPLCMQATPINVKNSISKEESILSVSSPLILLFLF